MNVITIDWERNVREIRLPHSVGHYRFSDKVYRLERYLIKAHPPEKSLRLPRAFKHWQIMVEGELLHTLRTLNHDVLGVKYESHYELGTIFKVYKRLT